MKVISFLCSLVLVAVGAWARVQYRGIHDEIHGSQGIQYGTLDQCFYDDGNALPGGWSASSNNQPNYKPQEPVSTGVQANPFLD